MENKVNEVVESFDSGLYCSQAILGAYCEEFGVNKEIASILIYPHRILNL